MTNTTTTAFRLLGYFWLEEVKVDDLKTIEALPDLAETLRQVNQNTLTELAAEYQRLFGFNLPPYESVFIDPSAMLMAPATERIQRLYQRANWSVPTNVRAGAPDHLGLELMALADCLEVGEDVSTSDLLRTEAAVRLQVDHLSLWVPPYILAFQRLSPAPFYETLSSLTLTLLLATLPSTARPKAEDLFPSLPPPPTFRRLEALAQQDMSTNLVRDTDQIDLISDPVGEKEFGLRQLIKRLLPPREAGLFLTREDLAQMGQALKLSTGMGDRYRMLETLFREAGQYDLIPQLLTELNHLFAETDQAYQQLAQEYKVWQPYAQAWGERLNQTQRLFDDLAETLSRELG